MAPTRSVRSSSLRPPLHLQPAARPEDADADDRAVADLLDAVYLNNVSRARRLVKELKAGKGVDEAVEAAALGVMGAKRRRPLHIAAAKGDVEMCRLLVKACNVDATDSDGATALILAIQGLGCTAIVRLLLINGADPNKVDNSGIAPLHIAAERGLYEVAELLLSKEAKVDLMCENGGAPIHVAAENGHAKMLKLLVQHKVNLNSRNPETALVIAAGKGLADCIKCLLEAGADANIPDEDGNLPIQIAACQGLKECVDILLPATTSLPECANCSIDEIIQHEKSASSPAATSLAECANSSIDEIIRHEETASLEAQVSITQVDDIEMKEFVQGRCNGSFAKIFKLFCGEEVVGSKRKGLHMLCQAYRYVIDMIRVNKKSWGGKFTPCNLRVIGGRKFLIDLEPMLPATADHTWADLNGITDCMAGYFVLGTKRSIYVRHLFGLCRKLHKKVARGMHEPGADDRYLDFIYNHPSYGFSIERTDLIKGIGMSLKYSSTANIYALVRCMSKDLVPPSEGEDEEDWRDKVIHVAVLRDVFFANVDKDAEDKEITQFHPKPKDNFIFCRHALEHGAERTLIKYGENGYRMFCPMCKQPLKSKYQQDLVCKAASAAGNSFQWVQKKILPETSTSSDIICQIQPLPSLDELDLLVGDIFDIFISDSICQIMLEPLLDNNPFVQARLKVFARSIRKELNGEGEEDEDEGS